MQLLLFHALHHLQQQKRKGGFINQSVNGVCEFSKLSPTTLPLHDSSITIKSGVSKNPVTLQVTFTLFFQFNTKISFLKNGLPHFH